jgi:hypothetical protein
MEMSHIKKTMLALDIDQSTAMNVHTTHIECVWRLVHSYSFLKDVILPDFNPSNTELNPICHLLALLRAHPIIHFSWIRVKVIHPTISCPFSIALVVPEDQPRSEVHLSVSCLCQFLRWGVVSTSPNLQAGGSHLVGCPWLRIQYIRSYPRCWRPLLHTRSEDALCHGARDPLIMGFVSLCCKYWSSNSYFYIRRTRLSFQWHETHLHAHVWAFSKPLSGCV